jgi:AraC-like DNA-binding protein/mannose-6-phosphate isomerase-like protein (cupin superfamily)
MDIQENLFVGNRNPLQFPIRINLPGLKLRFREMYLSDQNTIIPNHAHSYFETVYFLRGSGTYACTRKDLSGENKFEYGPGTLVETAPGAVHRFTCESKVRLVFWTWEAISGKSLGMFESIKVHNESGRFIEPVLNQIFNELASPRKDSRKVLRTTIFQLHRTVMNLLYPDPSALLDEPLTSKLPPRTLADEARRFIRDNFYLDISLSDVAKQFGLSTRQLMRILNSARPPVSFSRHLRNIRIQAACQLLIGEPDIRLAEVAQRCGFNDEYYFAKVFKKDVGLPPGEYRKRK